MASGRTCQTCGLSVAEGQDVTHGNWHQMSGETIRQLRLLADSARSAADAASLQLRDALAEIRRLHEGCAGIPAAPDARQQLREPTGAEMLQELARRASREWDQLREEARQLLAERASR